MELNRAGKIAEVLLEAEGYPLRKIGDFMDVLPTHVQKVIMAGMNSNTDSSTLSRQFRTAMMPYKRKLATVDSEVEFFAYLLVAIRNKLRPDADTGLFAKVIAMQMDKFTAHIEPLAPGRQITSTDIFGPASLN